MNQASDWFEVDKEGLAATIDEPERLPLELLQNALDEDVRTISISLTPESLRGFALLVVEDDCPQGFLNLSESYRLWAISKKRGDAEKRGRFNLGEKRVLACCREANIISTRGSVLFRSDGTKQMTKARRQTGTLFTGLIKLTKPQQEEALKLLRSVLLPEGIALTINDEEIHYRIPVTTFAATLPTVLPDEEGKLSRKTRRLTMISLVDPLPGEKPMIYELGIPVVEHDSRWHVDVGQCVPMNSERDNVPPSYLRQLREAILNSSHELLTPEDAKEVWVRDAYENATPDALRSVVKGMYGDKVVMHDPSDPEANKRALDKGYAVIPSRNPFPTGFGPRLREVGVLPAGKVMPSGVKFSEHGIPPLDHADWTHGMRVVAIYAAELAEELFGLTLHIEVYRLPFGEKWAACWSNPNRLSFNLTALGHRWFNEPDQEEVDALLIHEFSHRKAADHYSADFYDECCRLGAKMRRVTAHLESA